MLHFSGVLACCVYLALWGHVSAVPSRGQDSLQPEAMQSTGALQILAELLYAMPLRPARKTVPTGRNRATARMADDLKWTSSEESYKKERSGDDEEYEKKVAEQASLAKSDEAIAAQRALAEAAVAKLKENEEVVAFLKDTKKKKVGGILGALRPASPFDFKVIGEARKAEGESLEGVRVEFISGEFGESISAFTGQDMQDPGKMSDQFHQSECKAISVPVDYDFSPGPDALKATVDDALRQKDKDQLRTVMPVIARVAAIDPLQLAQVALAGANAVVISLSIAGEEKMRELMTVAAELGLAALIRVTSEEQMATALELGAKAIVLGDMTLTDAKALKQSLPYDVITVADLTFEDVRYARLIKKAGLGAMIAGESLLNVSVLEQRQPSDIIKAIRSKNSNAADFYGISKAKFDEGDLWDIFGKRETRGMEEDEELQMRDSMREGFP
jgi:indole-3-glycerol phosphate synthase